MHYTAFGRRTGLRVSEVALGTSNFGRGVGGDPDAARLLWGRRGDGAAPDDARRVLERFAEAGGTVLDTADSAQFGQAERLVGDFLAADRDHFVLSTKYTNSAATRPRISDTGNSRKNMLRSVEASLRRLGTDHIDLYWAHFPDALTPTEEILAGLDHLVRSGKVLYAGLSNFPAWRVARGATLAELHGWAPLVGIQAEYSLLNRTAERELLPMAEALGLGAALWSPLGGGLLTGKYRRTKVGWVSDEDRRHPRNDTDRIAAVVTAVRSVAEEVGVKPARISLAWLRARAVHAHTALVPVLGPRSVEQLDDCLAAWELTLDEEQVRRLDEASAVEAGTPHEITGLVQDILLGGGPHRLPPQSPPVA